MSTSSKRKSIKRFGWKLHLLRAKRDMTLQELAKELGYKAHGHLSELESGKKKPSIDLVLQVARFFRVTTDQLLKDEIDID